MQEVLNEFERLKVWELVPRPDYVMIITLKWIYKVKLDELGGVLKNKASCPHDMIIYRMDVKTAFLNGILREEKFYKGTVDPTLFIRREGTLLSKPTEKHLHAVKRIFRYLKGTLNMGLWYSKNSCIALTAFADADHAGCQDTRRSTSRSMQLVGDRLVSWSSKKQKSIAISSTEAEYIALSHIDIRYYFIKEQVENGVVELYFVRTEYQLTDIFTKALGRERLDFLINKLEMRSMSPEMLKSLAEEEDE
ncbi:hypothetical protein Tco_1038286 [Tanacetum coccineum]